MQGAARGALEAYDPKTSAQRLLASVHTALAQTAVLQAGAAGVSGMVAVKAASLVDLTGLLPAALLAVTGFAVLPVQRYRLQADLQQRVAELTATLDTALRGHLEEELQHASSRARDIVAPFAAEADAAAPSSVRSRRSGGEPRRGRGVAKGSRARFRAVICLLLSKP